MWNIAYNTGCLTAPRNMLPPLANGVYVAIL